MTKVINTIELGKRRKVSTKAKDTEERRTWESWDRGISCRVFYFKNGASFLLHQSSH